MYLKHYFPGKLKKIFYLSFYLIKQDKIFNITERIFCYDNSNNCRYIDYPIHLYKSVFHCYFLLLNAWHLGKVQI